jgi:hypothetical protein
MVRVARFRTFHDEGVSCNVVVTKPTYRAFNRLISDSNTDVKKQRFHNDYQMGMSMTTELMFVEFTIAS